MSVREDYWDRGPWTRLEKWVNGELTVLVFSQNADDVHRRVADDGMDTGDINEFRIETNGSNIKAYIKVYKDGAWSLDKLIFDVTGPQFSSGRIGVSTYSMSWAYIDYIASQ